MLKYVFRLLAALGIVALVCAGCEYDDDDDYPGVKPVFKSAELFNAANPNQEEINFEVGDTVGYWVYGTDVDKDIVTLWVTFYHPSNSQTIYSGPSAKIMPEVTTEGLEYTRTQAFTISADDPPGDWRVDFQFEDSRGHKSNIISIPFYILPST